MAAQYDPAFRELRQQIKLLDFYYVEARYPSGDQGSLPGSFACTRDDSGTTAWRDWLFSPWRLACCVAGACRSNLRPSADSLGAAGSAALGPAGDSDHL